MTDNYDLVVIGGGPGGQAAAELAAHFGHRAVIIENDKPGGVVTTTGGVPTKTLREAALFLMGVGQEEVYGIRTGVPLETAMPILRTRTPAVCESLQQIIGKQFADRGVDFLRGIAKLRSDRTVSVTLSEGNIQEISGNAIIVATGSSPTHFANVPFDDPDVYDSDRILSIRKRPANIVIVGGGPIGVEFATVFMTLGLPVTLIQQGDRLLPNMDGELVELMTAEFRRRGARLILSAGVNSVSRDASGLRLALSTGETLNAAAVLYASGRTPNTSGIGLEDAGVEVDNRARIRVDRYYRTTTPGIYAVGDVLGPTLASIAMQQGRAAACHALGLIAGVTVDRFSSSAVYGLPEIAGVGMTEEQAKAAGIPYVVGRCDLARTARGVISGHGGRLKLILRPDDRKLLGIHCIGDIASELVGMGHVALHANAAVDIFLMLAFNTPTYSFAYRDAAIDGLNQLAVSMGFDRMEREHELAAHN